MGDTLKAGGGAVSSRVVALLFGGVSPEHAVSVASAAKVAEGLAELGQRAPLGVEPIYINHEGRWVFGEGTSVAQAGRPTAEEIRNAPRWEFDGGAIALNFAQALARLAAAPPAAVFIALHGMGGEDGRIQAALDLAGIPYTGSGVAASALGLNKPRCQAVLNAAGVPIAPSTVVRPALDGVAVVDHVKSAIGVPCVVKPANGGSSVATTIVTDEEQLHDALAAAAQVDDEVMVERFVRGREFTCGLLERAGELIALPITEIIPPDGHFFDYDAKYVAGVSREITPADIPGSLAMRMQTLARRVYLAVGCRGYARVDFIADPTDPIVLEINTLPGMTDTSLLPQAAAVVGIPFPALLEQILANAARG